jgi:hypothetical protein
MWSLDVKILNKVIELGLLLQEILGSGPRGLCVGQNWTGRKGCAAGVATGGAEDRA